MCQSSRNQFPFPCASQGSWRWGFLLLIPHRSLFLQHLEVIVWGAFASKILLFVGACHISRQYIPPSWAKSSFCKFSVTTFLFLLNFLFIFFSSSFSLCFSLFSFFTFFWDPKESLFLPGWPQVWTFGFCCTFGFAPAKLLSVERGGSFGLWVISPRVLTENFSRKSLDSNTHGKTY